MSASPIAYIVTGFWALVFGYLLLRDALFLPAAEPGQATGMGPQSVNVNQDMIRYVLSNASVVGPFVLPAITMRTYSGGKPVGHHRAAADLAADRPADHSRKVPGGNAGVLRRDAARYGPLYRAALLVRGTRK